MTIMQKVAMKQLWLNKKRTAITIFGVIVSVAMITSVITLSQSFLDMMQRQAIADTGEWHVKYESVDQSQLESIVEDSNTDEVLIEQVEGYALLEQSQNPARPYIYISRFNQESFSHFPVEMVKGRLPENETELIMHEAFWLEENDPISISDQLTLDIGQRTAASASGEDLELGQNRPLNYGGETESLLVEQTREYTVVGVYRWTGWQTTTSPAYSALSYTDGQLASDLQANAFVQLGRLDRGLFDHAKALALREGIDEVEFNDTLLRYAGVVASDRIRRMISVLSVIILTIIVLGSISLIYNAFAISVSERSRQLGMLSSIGATKKQKRNTVLFEGAVIGAVSIPLGLAAGLAGMQVTFWVINTSLQEVLSVSQDLNVVISFWGIAAAVAVSSLTLMGSTYLPAKRASSMTAIEAIRQSEDIKMTVKDVKTPYLVNRLFGIEGELALKNLKRNKTSYRAIVLSLATSLLLFLSVTYFTTSFSKSMEMSQEGIAYDISVTVQAEDRSGVREVSDLLRTLEGVEAFSTVSVLDARTWIDEEDVPSYYLDQMTEDSVDGRYPYYVMVNGLDDHTLQVYAEENDLDMSRLTDSTDPSAVLIDLIRYEESGTSNIVERTAVNTASGTDLELEEYVMETEDYQQLSNIEVADTSERVPLGVSLNIFPGSFHLIVSNVVFDQLMDSVENEQIASATVYLASDDPIQLQRSIEEVSRTYGQGIQLSFYNVYAQRQREERMMTLVTVFTSAFVLLITIISAATLFNTVSTSIILRKREFAMLKSMGMTEKSFSKMIRLESLFYGMKSILLGLPISVLIMYAIYRQWAVKFIYAFELPWAAMAAAIIGVFLLTGLSMIYASRKLHQSSIIDSLKQENI